MVQEGKKTVGTDKRLVVVLAGNGEDVDYKGVQGKFGGSW